MIDGIPVGAFANGVGVVTVVLIVGWMIATGRLVPRRYYELEVKRGDKVQEAVDSLTKQLREITTDKDLGLHFLESMRIRAESARGDEK